MKRRFVLLALVGSAVVMTQARAETVSTRLTREKPGDHLWTFTVKVERLRENDAGKFLEFRVTAKPKDPTARQLPRRVGGLAVYDGKKFVSSCEVRGEASGGEVSFTFRVAEKYAGKSRFTFAETADHPVERGGFYYWFYFKDFLDPD